MPTDLDDVDAILAMEASEMQRDEEISRILTAFPLDAYTVLDLQPGCTTDVVKKTYRKKSLLIHPDKSKNPQAPDAFDKLKKAESILQDDKQRQVLDKAFADSRRLLIQEKKWTYDDSRLKSSEFHEEWRNKTKEVLIENELRRRKLAKMQMEQEGREKRRLEEEAEARRRKREAEKAWEDNRDTRVESWRAYQKKRKRVKRTNVLG